MKKIVALAFVVLSFGAFAESDKVICSNSFKTADREINDDINRLTADSYGSVKKQFEITAITSTGAGLGAGGFQTCVVIREKK